MKLRGGCNGGTRSINIKIGLLNRPQNNNLVINDFGYFIEIKKITLHGHQIEQNNYMGFAVF